MPINKDVETYAKKADEAFDSNNYSELKEITNECYELLKSPKYSELDKAILSYHAATSYSNYIRIFHKGLVRHLEDGNNESDFEFCILLFRKSLSFFSSFYTNNNELESVSAQEKQHYFTYLSMAQTNYANQLFQCGRLLLSIQQLKPGTDDKFAMAAGNMACKLISYAEYDYDKGHRDIFCNEAYQLLLSALEIKLPQETRSYFESQKR